MTVPIKRPGVWEELGDLNERINNLERTGGGGSAGPATCIATWSFARHPYSAGAMQGIWRVPEVAGVSTTFDVSLCFVRNEVRCSSGTYTILFQKSAAGGAFSATTIATLTLTSADYEDTETGTGMGTITSGNLLRVYYSTVGTGGTTVNLELEATAQ